MAKSNDDTSKKIGYFHKIWFINELLNIFFSNSYFIPDSTLLVISLIFNIFIIVSSIVDSSSEFKLSFSLLKFFFEYFKKSTIFFFSI